ncbi:MAG: HD domain-containing protein [Pirellulaceae bacterium]|jgi:phosphonate degradation associated HDIG domain protein|nr:HD domain-containing protein [Pirellulaceae bacterium]
MSGDRGEIIEQVLRLFRQRGGSEYGGEAVTQQEHALQSAHFARQAGASQALVAAALLHDIGHLLHDLPDDAPAQGVDDRHEALGAAWLSRWFIPEVAEPVRLHVAAKRYLCAAEPAYFQQLSQPSRLSLELQGGPMSTGELEQFRASPHFSAAVLLRRWDEAAKVPGMLVAGIDEYSPDLQAVLALRRCAS